MKSLAAASAAALNSTVRYYTHGAPSFRSSAVRSNNVTAVAAIAAPFTGLSTPLRFQSSGTSELLKAASGSVSLGKGNYFRFFDIPEQPELDVNSLQKRYHELQVRVHPDKQSQHEGKDEGGGEGAEGAGGLSDAGRESLTGVSTYANTAYETLREPFARCRYLLRLYSARLAAGGPDAVLSVADEERIDRDDDLTAVQMRTAEQEQVGEMSEAFLEEMMAINEAIFMADMDNEDVRKSLIILRADLKERDADYFHQAVQLWGARDMPGFRINVLEWTYVNNALYHLKNRM